jgi:hypothetical protein
LALAQPGNGAGLSMQQSSIVSITPNFELNDIDVGSIARYPHNQARVH